MVLTLFALTVSFAPGPSVAVVDEAVLSSNGGACRAYGSELGELRELSKSKSSLLLAVGEADPRAVVEISGNGMLESGAGLSDAMPDV